MRCVDVEKNVSLNKTNYIVAQYQLLAESGVESAVCVRACVRACAHASVRACVSVRVCVFVWGEEGGVWVGGWMLMR